MLVWFKGKGILLTSQIILELIVHYCILSQVFSKKMSKFFFVLFCFVSVNQLRHTVSIASNIVICLFLFFLHCSSVINKKIIQYIITFCVSSYEQKTLQNGFVLVKIYQLNIQQINNLFSEQNHRTAESESDYANFYY